MRAPRAAVATGERPCTSSVFLQPRPRGMRYTIVDSPMGPTAAPVGMLIKQLSQSPALLPPPQSPLEQQGIDRSCVKSEAVGTEINNVLNMLREVRYALILLLYA